MRVLLTETVDPDGAMYRWLSPALEAAGHRVVVVPGQEAAHHLGVSGFQALLVAAADALDPDLIITHPPYDHMSAATADRLRTRGARLVGFAFDDPIFIPEWRVRGPLEAVLTAIDACYDAWLTTSRGFADLAAASAPGSRVLPIRWAMCPPSPPSPPPDDVPARVVLVGTAYPTRVALVRTLAAAGLPLLVRGHGWPEAAPQLSLPAHADVDLGGHVDAASAVELLRAGIVVSTADWEDRPVPMLKLRVLEAAFAGACQVAAACPELGAHFTPDEVTPYSDPADLVAVLGALLADAPRRAAMAAAARDRARREHTWEARLPELLGALAAVGRPVRAATAARHEPRDCPTLALTAMSLATSAEFTGRPAAAAAFFAHAEGAGAGVSATLGRARCAVTTGDNAGAIALIEPILGALAGAVQPAQATLRSRVTSRAHGTGLGHNRLLAPHLEAIAFLLTAYAATGREEDARAVLADLDADAIVLIAAMLEGDDAGGPVYDLLFAAALAARPVGLAADQEAHAPRWRAWLVRPRP